MAEQISTQTLKEFFEVSKQKEFKSSSLFLKRAIEVKEVKLIINDFGILDKYMDALRDYRIELDLTDEQYDNYKLRPKKLAHWLYHSTEYWSLILEANEIYSASQFDMRRPKVFSLNKLATTLQEIMSIERPFININTQILLDETIN